MKWKALVAQLANRINQPHVIETYMRKVYTAGVVSERNRNINKQNPEDVDYTPWYCGRKECCRNGEGFLPLFTCDKALCNRRISKSDNTL